MSVARAGSLCVPFGTKVVFQLNEYGAFTSGGPSGRPSSSIWTSFTPTVLVASMVSGTDAPNTGPLETGGVTDTPGGTTACDAPAMWIIVDVDGTPVLSTNHSW